MKSNEGWSSQLWTQFMQLRKEAWKKFRTSTGFEPVTSRYRCDALTNWAMKPLTLGAVHMWFISYTSFTFISFTGTYEPTIDLCWVGLRRDEETPEHSGQWCCGIIQERCFIQSENFVRWLSWMQWTHISISVPWRWEQWWKSDRIGGQNIYLSTCSTLNQWCQ